VSATVPTLAMFEALERRIEELEVRVSETAEPQSPYMSIAEAAAYLRCSRQRVYDLLSSRRLPKRKDGARVLIARKDLDVYLNDGLTGRAAWPRGGGA
jgi:excisionase family DNA binding protein